LEIGIGNLSGRIQLFGWLWNRHPEIDPNTARKLAPQREPFPNSERESTESSGKGTYASTNHPRCFLIVFLN
jgi:hypothetical protein